jgi:hypothetical protein
MMSSRILYYNHCVLELFGQKLCTNNNANALRTVLLELVYSSFYHLYPHFMALNHQNAQNNFK